MTDPVPLSFGDARRAAFDAASVLPPTRVPLADAVGRTLTRDLVASTDVPHYPSSAMDGWAVRGAGPWRVVASAALGPGEATPILTGGLVPADTDAILRSEHGHARAGVLTATITPGAGRHIRPAAEEARAGEVVVRAGTVVNPVHAAIAAGCGLDVLEVLAQPRVALVLTGDEVVERGLPEPGRVRDSFGPMLPAVIASLGGRVIRTVRLRDDRAALTAAILETEADVVVTTGSTGDSPADHLRAALRDIGAELTADGVAIRPGAPSLLARLPNGRHLVGLPGNPLAAMMGLLTLAHPLIAALRGVDRPTLGSAIADAEVRGTPHRTALVPCHLHRARVTPTGWRGSGMLRGLAEADAVLIVPPGGIRRGDSVGMIRLPWL